MLPSQDTAPPNPTTEVLIIDGAAIVNMLRPGVANTFNDYATDIFLPYISSHLQHTSRVDVVWDEYISDSLKAGVRSKRGKGVRRRVEPSSTIPGNWQEFLRIDDKNTELFAYLATRLAAMDTDKQVISTYHNDVLCTQTRDLSGLAPCTHEEADTRILLHVEDAAMCGHTKIAIRTVDTDVLVLAVTSAQRLDIPELWVAFGTGKNFRFLPAHDIARELGPERCVALSMFHAFTVCDTVSCFGGRGKRTAWDTWNVYDEVTPAFCALAATPDSIEDWVQPLERFVVLLYDRTSGLGSINQARKQLFTQKSRTFDNLPPTKAALIQHTKRAAYQAGHCWGQMMIAVPELPSPSEWGLEEGRNNHWELFWTTLPEATQALQRTSAL